MRLTRRGFLGGIAALAVGGLGPFRTAAADGVPRFALLYSNDATNLATCVSPFHRKGQAVTAATVQASVDEAAAADCQILQPGHGWVPLWRSRSYPVADHLAWWSGQTGTAPNKVPNTLLRTMLAGDDILGAFVARCRALGRFPITSLRLNDVQMLRGFGEGAPLNPWISRFYVEHPEYRLGGTEKGLAPLALDWTIPAVRAEKFAFVAEMIDDYDVAGVELDFLRGNAYFRTDRTTAAERRQIMTEFVAAVRQRLDAKTGGARRLALMVRLPALLAFHDALGLDVRSLAEAGVDVFTLSNSYYTSHRADLEAFRAIAPAAQHFLEATHVAAAGIRNPALPGDPGHVRTSDLQFRTVARAAVARGGDGLALFNFAYYRTQAAGDPTPGTEPPFHLLPELAAPKAIAPHPSWWFVAQGWGPGPAGREDYLPRPLSPRRPLGIVLHALPPGGPGVLRLRARRSLAGATVAVSLGGLDLTQIAAPDGLFATRSPAGQGSADYYVHFACPAEAIIPGWNRVLVTTASDSLIVTACDLVFPS